MAHAVDQAQQERDLTKQAIEADLNRLEGRIRAELDWKARLRRDAPQIIAVVGGFLAVAVGAVVLRRVLRGKSEDEVAAAIEVASLQDVAAELRALREELERTRRKNAGPPLLQKLAVTAVSTAVSAGAKTAAKRMTEQGAERQAAAAR